MSLCTECGNKIVVGSGPICLVCQHTGRGLPEHLIITPKGQDPQTPVPADAQIRGLAVALDAVYAAMENTEAKLTVIEAQQMLRHRIRFPGHNRERPDWEEEDREERERNTCGLCCGTGLIMGKHCPECWAED